MATDPSNVLALGERRTLSQLHKFNDARPDKALTIDPNNTEALINKGLSLYNIDKKIDAIAYYDKALAIDPDNNLAQNLKQRKELESNLGH